MSDRRSRGFRPHFRAAWFRVLGFTAISTLSGLAQTPGVFVATGNTFTPRIGHTATLMKDGRVLITGGQGAANSTEIYDPATGTFAGTGGMIRSRVWHEAILLGDGRVLITGGWGPSGFLTSAELYDPATESFSPAGNMTIPRRLHQLNTLKDEKVFISGGGFFELTLDGVPSELYDPATGTFTPAGGEAKTQHAAAVALLADGRVLMVGGIRAPSPSGTLPTLLFDPATSLTTMVGLPKVPYWAASATTLRNGKVLIAGGEYFSGRDETVGGDTRNFAELYDPLRESFDFGGFMFAARSGHTATLLSDGSVLMAGGSSLETMPAPPYGGEVLASAELYDPATGSFRATGAMSAPRISHTATLLRNGTVLIVGGREDTSAEIYIPQPSTPQN